MIATLSILGLLALTTWLINLETIAWPPQRTEALYDAGYWHTVRQDSLDYLKIHKNLSPEIKQEVNQQIVKASRRLAKLGKS